ncbi:MAG: LPP20 family lipoprotein [Flavobacteriales bacterium]|nr:LPP20 family lipoprotein [Flavobacteriales bacterium]
MKSTNVNLTLFFGLLLIVLAGCGSSSTLGEKVKEPFSGSQYESNKRYWRAVGKGDSMDENIAKNKADLQAKKELAQQVETRMKVVTDQYLSETEVNNASELNDKFESLAREVTNTQIADIRKIGEEKYYDGEKYTVFIAYEIHKKQMLRFMKKKAKADAKMDKAQQKAIEDIIDRELSELED